MSTAAEKPEPDLRDIKEILEEIRDLVEEQNKQLDRIEQLVIDLSF